MNHSDIKTNSWALRFLPETFRPYALLMRLDRPIGVWLLVLPGWWAIVLTSYVQGLSYSATTAYMALFGLGAVIMRGAGCVINDLWDRDLDKKVKRTKSRPLANDTISSRNAIIFLSGLLGLGLIILLQFNTYTIVLGILSLPLIASYPLMKRFTFWPQAYLGLVFNFSVLMGWSAVLGTVNIETFLLYASCILWTLGYDTVYACQDKDDDLLVGIKSTALLFGDHVQLWVIGFYLLCFTGLLISTYLVFGHFLAVIMLIPAGTHFFWQITAWDMADQQSSLTIFKSNRDFGLLVLLGLTCSAYLLAA